MTGFIRGLFGRKKQEDTPQVDEPAPKKPGAYFLDPDDAKTFGDIDYMRTAKTVRRSYAKGKARVRQISALNEVELADGAISEPASADVKPASFAQPPESPAPSSFASSNSGQSTNSGQSANSTPQPRRAPDSSMDMFRNMAKEIRKK